MDGCSEFFDHGSISESSAFQTRHSSGPGPAKYEGTSTHHEPPPPRLRSLLRFARGPNTSPLGSDLHRASTYFVTDNNGLRTHDPSDVRTHKGASVSPPWRSSLATRRTAPLAAVILVDYHAMRLASHESSQHRVSIPASYLAVCTCINLTPKKAVSRPGFPTHITAPPPSRPVRHKCTHTPKKGAHSRQADKPSGGCVIPSTHPRPHRPVGLAPLRCISRAELGPSGFT